MPAGKVRVRRHGETAVRAAFQTGVAVAVVTAARSRTPSTGRALRRQATTSSTTTSSPSSPRCASSRRTCAPTPSSSAGPSSTPSASCRRPTRCGRSSPTPRPTSGRSSIDALLDRPEFDRLLGAVPRRPAAEPQGARPRRARRQGRARLPRLDPQAGGRQPALGRAGPRRAHCHAARAADNPAVGYYVVTVGETRRRRRSPRSSPRWPRRSSARASAAPSATTTRSNATRRTTSTTSPASSRASSSTARSPKKGPTTLRVGRHRRQGPHGQGAGRRQPAAHRRVPQPRAARPLSRRRSSPATTRACSWPPGSTDPKNEYFSGAMVNRVWKHYLGVGLVEPVDDLRASNPPTQPRTVEGAQRASSSARKFDLQAPDAADPELADLPAQLGARTPGNATDTRFYSHYYARRLPAEVLLDAVSQATGVPESSPATRVGLRAVQLPDPGAEVVLPDAVRPVRPRDGLRLRAQRRGDAAATAAPPERRQLSSPRSRRPTAGWPSCSAEKKTDDAIVEELFLATLSRLPTAGERAAVRAAVGRRRRAATRCSGTCSGRC